MQLQQTMIPAMNDEGAMLRVKNGEVRELDVLFRRHARPLYGFFYGLCRNAALCDDLVQEVFWRILRYRETFDERKSFKAWLYRIARNLFADRMRKEARHPVEEIETLEERADPQARRADQVAVEQDEKGRLLAALDALPPEQREILVLARFEGLTFRAIGEILGCSEGAAKVRAFRALQALRELFLEREGSASR